MTDGDAIILVLWVLYLAECFWWVGREAVVLRQGMFSFHWAQASGLGTESAGVTVLSPLVSGMAFECHAWPIAVTEQGFCAAEPSDADCEWMYFADLRTINVDGQFVQVNGRRLVRTANVKSAEWCVALLERLKSEPPSGRTDAIATALRHSLDVAHVREQFAVYRRELHGLRIWSGCLAALLLVVVPLVIKVPAMANGWAVVTITGMTCLLGTLRSYWRAHRALSPAETSVRWRTAGLMLLAPFSAARCADRLCRGVFCRVHPLALGLVLLSRDSLALHSRRTLAEILHPIAEESSRLASSAHDIRCKFRRRLLCEIRTMLEMDRWDVAALMAPPLPDDARVQTYCPRCDAQFTLSDGCCTSCPGVHLVELQKEHSHSSDTLTTPTSGL